MLFAYLKPYSATEKGAVQFPRSNTSSGAAFAPYSTVHRAWTSRMYASH